jgi:mono/diheme cytochrome c family protein
LFVCSILAASSLLQACGLKPSSRAMPPPQSDTGTTTDATPAATTGTATGVEVSGPGADPVSPSERPAKRVEATLLLALRAPGNDAPTDASVRQILDDHCVRCHGSSSPTRWSLTDLPPTEQLGEIQRRIELAPGAPGRMPLGSEMGAGERDTLGKWIVNRLGATGPTRFAEASVEAFDQDGDERLQVRARGDGRYEVALGSRVIGQIVSLRLTVTETGRAPQVILLQAVAVPEDGITYAALEVPEVRENGGARPPTGEAAPAVDTPAAGDVTPAVVTPLLQGGDTATGDTGTGNRDTEPTRTVAARLELRLVTAGSPLVADSAVLAILRTSCQTCHNGSNAPRWDLTVLPPRAYWAEIARRINLDESDAAHMPIGGTLEPQALATLSQWLAEQQNPPAADAFAGYTVRAAFIASPDALAASALQLGRTRIELGPQQPGATLRLQLEVSGLDGVVQELELPVQIDATGIANADVTVAPRDNTAPTVEDASLQVTSLGPTSATIRVVPASDDRPASLLTYELYRSSQSELDSRDEIVAHGVRIGEGISGDREPVFELSDLEPAHTYYFNVVVRDRTGNEAVYRKLQVLTLPQALCDGIVQSGGMQAWRDGLARELARGSLAEREVVSRVRACFPEAVPQCVQRTLSYAERSDVAPFRSDGGIDELPQKRPPDEIKDLATGNYFIPEDIEAIARARGWTAVRYKSRHAGGFDMGTPNLLMVYVPGDRVSPPVTFDRWLNFPLPKDDDEPALGLPQNPRPKFGPPAREEYALRDRELPRTFTLMSLDRGGAGGAATVYFQKFRRGSGPLFTPESAENVGSCVRCHPNGLRAISPLGYHVREGEERLADEDWKAVELINRKMVEAAGFKAPAWGTGRTADGVEKPLYRAERGPIIGAARPINALSRTRAFIMGGTVDGQQVSGCYDRHRTISVRDIFGRRPGSHEPTYRFTLSSSPAIDPDKVIRAMSCEGCHVDGQRWPLNDSTSYDQIQFKILVDQSMPLGLHLNPLDAGNETGGVVDLLTPDERIALSNCLEAEFELERASLDKWLMQESCP